MESLAPARVRRPSRFWRLASLLSLATALSLCIAAIVNQRAATRPVGEGELFQVEARSVVDQLAKAADLHSAVRHARNALGIEAVGVVDASGEIVASTSENWLGGPLGNEFLAMAADGGGLMAMVTSLDKPVWIDGVEEWGSGEALYAIAHPLSEGGAALLHYDVAELLERRSAAEGVQPATLQLAGIGLAFALLAGVLVFARSRADRRYRELALETRLLQEHNVELEAARRRAEEALALAEEKNRVRSEFVLMINHELRTPLTALVTGAALLAEGDLDDHASRQVLDDILADGRRLEDLIVQILTMARIENRGLEVQLQPTAVTDVCDRVADLNPRLVTECAGHDPDVRIRTDLTTVTQLIGSLADNALNHGASKARFWCTGALDFEPDVASGPLPPRPIYFVVSDDGPGIPEEFLPRLFEKFEKDSFSSGTGLGMYLASVVADALEGAIVVGTGDAGTTMAIALPVASGVAA